MLRTFAPERHHWRLWEAKTDIVLAWARNPFEGKICKTLHLILRLQKISIQILILNRTEEHFLSETYEKISNISFMVAVGWLIQKSIWIWYFCLVQLQIERRWTGLYMDVYYTDTPMNSEKGANFISRIISIEIISLLIILSLELGAISRLSHGQTQQQDKHWFFGQL